MQIATRCEISPSSGKVHDDCIEANERNAKGKLMTDHSTNSDCEH